jgi:nicotinamidase-related amidase
MIVVTKALLLVDIQQDYFPGGKMELHNADGAAAQAGALLARFRSAQLPIVHVRHVSEEPGAGFFLPDTDGIEFHPAVRPVPGERIITKHTPNSFLRTDLGEYLASTGIKTLVIAGMMTHMCIDSTARAASDEGFECVVVADACATCDQDFAGTTVDAPRVHAAFLAALNGTFVNVLTLDELDA